MYDLRPMDELLLNVESKEIRAAQLRNGKLYNLNVERKKERQLTGNIYLGQVQNILENIQSAFIDINEGDNGFIHISDILENTAKFENSFDLDFNRPPPKEKEEKKDIQQILQPNQTVLVQVVKEPLGNKGARLTSNISIAGRYLVLLPNSSHRGVSRKIEDRSTRERLKKLIRSFEMPVDMGLICRTASKFASQEMLVKEAHELFDNWQKVMETFNKSKKPTLLHEESGLIKRSIITAIDKRYERVLIDDYETFQICKKMASRYETEHPLKIELFRDTTPMYERFNVEKEIEKSLRRKIWLGHGGYLYFEKTEAMHTIDVNSGRSNISTDNVEEALVRINIEAAEEIARQLRIRNIGGLVICDFIDMRFRKNQRRVLEKLREFVKEDSAKITILGMSEFGLIEMTRQRKRGSLAHTMFIDCPYCNGRGSIKSYETVTVELERALKKAINNKQQFALRVVTHPEIDNYLKEKDKKYLEKMSESLNAHTEWGTDDTLHLNQFYFVSTINGEEIGV